MLPEEAGIIQEMLKGFQGKRVLNLCSSGCDHYRVRQPFIGSRVIDPLVKRKNRVVHLDVKREIGVDIVCDCSEMHPVEDDSFDIVLFCSGIEHVYDLRKTFSEIRRVLKHGGILVASAPGRYPRHDDPVDTLRRMPRVENWRSLLQDGFKIQRFDRTAPFTMRRNGDIHRGVFATAVRAVLNKKHPQRPVIDAFVLSYRREENLPRVIRGLKRQTMVRDIVLFHNHPSRRKIRGVRNIFSEVNFGCLARHAIAQLSDCDYALFVDDDLEAAKDLSHAFLEGIRISPRSVIGPFGADIDPNARPPAFYGSGGHFEFPGYYRYVDIVKGLFHLVPRDRIAHSFRWIRDRNIEELRCDDDVILNLSGQLFGEPPSLLVPCSRGDIRPLPHPHAVFQRPDHKTRRSFLVSLFMRSGWKPVMQNERFRKQNRKLGGTRFERDRDAFLLQKALRERNFQRFETILGKNGTGRVPVLLRYHYASLLQQHGRAERAMQIFRGIARGKKSVEPRLYAGACYHLFELYRDAGRNRNALVALKRCLESAPDHRKASHAWRESGAGAFPGKKTA